MKNIGRITSYLEQGIDIQEKLDKASFGALSALRLANAIKKKHPIKYRFMPSYKEALSNLHNLLMLENRYSATQLRLFRELKSLIEEREGGTIGGIE